MEASSIARQSLGGYQIGMSDEFVAKAIKAKLNHRVSMSLKALVGYHRRVRLVARAGANKDE